MNSKKQEDILLSLLQGGNGEKWASDPSRNGWQSTNSNDDGIGVCFWDGVDCDSKDRIIALILPSSKLEATIPSVFGKLSNLQDVRLQNNTIFGTIPPEFASLPNLQRLNLNKNALTGSLPESFKSPYLRMLDLRSNHIDGSIPDKFVVSSSCEEISLAENMLYGTIPRSIFQLSKLDTLDLSSNFLSGTISEKIGDLVLLRSLYLNDNFFIGSIPSSIAKSSSLRKNTSGSEKLGLEEIWLSDNDLSGSIPVQLADLKLRKLYIHNNKLTGEIPADLCSESLNPEFFRDVPPNADKHFCNSIACPSDYTSKNGKYPCERCFDMHHNPYIGQIGSCATAVSQRDILKIFHESTTMPKSKNLNDKEIVLEGGGEIQMEIKNGMDVKDEEKLKNWMDDSTFLCDFTGVTCDNKFHVTEINLPNYGLRGTIPPEIGFLTYLEVLDVSDNELYGYLPSDLRWAPLKRLDISGNQLQGIVPPTLCAKAHLNENGRFDDFNCDHVACPAGLYSPSGRKDLAKSEFCEPCHHVIPPVLAFKDCDRSGVPSDIFGIVFASITIFITAVLCFAVIKKYRKPKQSSSEGIALYEFTTKVQRSSNNASEVDPFMEKYVASAGEVSQPYTDNPVMLDRMRRRNTNDEQSGDTIISSGSETTCQNESRRMNHVSAKDIRQPIQFKRTTPKKKRKQNKIGGSVGSVGSGSGRSVGSESRKSSGSVNSKGDHRVWLDVPNIE